MNPLPLYGGMPKPDLDPGGPLLSIADAHLPLRHTAHTIPGGVAGGRGRLPLSFPQPILLPAL